MEQKLPLFSDETKKIIALSSSLSEIFDLLMKQTPKRSVLKAIRAVDEIDAFLDGLLLDYLKMDHYQKHSTDQSISSNSNKLNTM